MGVSKRLIGAGATASGGLTPSDNFKVITYTGTGSTQSITGVGFKPDWIWIKNRNDTNGHILQDSTRGVGKTLFSHLTSAESGNSGDLITSFDTDGFTVNENFSGSTTNESTNKHGNTYVAWCWKGNGGTTSSNSDGSITSTVQANADAGFSIVAYQGTQSNATVGHGLGIAPKLVITKSRGTAQGWPTLIVGSDGTVYGGTRLNESNANSSGNGTGFFQNTAPTTSVFTLGSSDESNPNGTNTIAYCFADVSGYQKIGTYTGDGSDNGPIVETGFEPAYIMIKRVNSTGNWQVWDNKRSTTNPRNKLLFPNDSAAEQTLAYVDFLSNGFQIVDASGATGGTNVNVSGSTYIYWAVAADPDTEAPTLASSFNAELYTGNATDNSVNIGFDSGLTWIKNRTDAGSYHILFDVVRGLDKVIHTGRNNAEQDSSNNFSYENGILSFDSNTTWGNKEGSNYVAWTWKANDNEPTLIPAAGPDSVDNEYPVVAYYNIVYTTSGKFNGGYTFNGVATSGTGGSAIFVPQFERNTSIDFTSSGVSASGWFYSTGTPSGSDSHVLFSMYGDCGFNIQYNSSRTIIYSGAINGSTNKSMPSNAWTHIVFTYSSSGYLKVYVDGSASNSYNVGTSALQSGSPRVNGIGGVPDNGDHTGPSSWFYAFQGTISQVRYFNSELTQANVNTLYGESSSDNDTLDILGDGKCIAAYKLSKALEDLAIVSVNSNAGFSISQATFASEGSIPHGLSQAPNFVIMKGVDTTEDWLVYHSSLGTGKYLSFNRNGGGDGAVTRADSFSSVTATSVTNSWTGSTVRWVMYSFHNVTGYQKFGSYTGNGSSTGPSVTTGFKPDFLMVKKTNSSANWRVVDSRRGATSSSGSTLFPNLDNAEFTGSSEAVEFTSTGFQIKNNDNSWNENSHTFIYWAIAKNVPSNTTLADSFGITRYVGTGYARDVNLGLRPDFVWGKNRDASESHWLYDTMRTASKVIESNSTIVNTSVADRLSAFNSNGIFIGGSDSSINGNGADYVSWSWKAGNNWESNLDGSIPSVVNANTANGFSIIKYTGTSASSQSVGHGLNSTPELIMIKNLEATEGWIVWATGFGTSNWLELNSSQVYNQDNAGWGGTHSSTVVNLQNSGAARSSANGVDYIAYCWHSVSNFSKIATYTGNGSTQSITGLGFAPDFVLLKELDGVDSWQIYDRLRGVNKVLYPNGNNAEYSGSELPSFDSDGFTVSGNPNENGKTYLYMAVKQNATLSTEKANSFGIVEYTGNSTQRDIEVGFQPDLVWTKRTSAAQENCLVDSVRGGGKVLYSDLTSATSNSPQETYNFFSTGFSLGTGGLSNNNGTTNIAWAWKAGNNWVNNNSGSVSSITNYNTGNKFSIVRWTGTGSATTVGHNLGTTPTFIIAKTMESAAKWRVYHSALGATKALNLSDSDAAGTSANYWNDTAPTSSVFSVGSDLSPSGEQVIAYVWADCSGYSKFGTFTGNGSTNNITGLGFQPDWVLIKETSQAESWRLFDSVRGATKRLFPDLDNAESAASDSLTSFDSDGFTLGASSGVNENSQTYIYAAFKIN